MTELAHSALFVVAVVALASAAARLGALVAPGGGWLERALVTAVLASTAAVLECLGLGLVGAGSDSLALAGAAVLSWAAARVCLAAPAPAREPGIWALALEDFRGAAAPARAAVGGLAGLLAGLAVFCLQHPLVGLDGVAYHLAEIVAWIQSGHPGAVVASIPGVPTGAYPLTNEVLLSWGMGLTRSFTPVALWSTATLGLLLGGGWLGLRRLRVPGPLAALALAALVASPDFTAELNTPMNDGATLAWLVVAAALVACAIPDRPGLYAVAGLAGALAIGTKTTTAPLVVLVLGLGAWRMRRWSRPAVLLAGLAGLAAAGTWYVRNLIAHGSPFWPLLPGPFGDPVPSALVPADVRFISRPLATLHGRLHDYERLLAGNVLLLAGGLAAGLLRRRVWAVSLVTGVSVLIWADAPFTGIGRDPAGDLSLAVTRYMLPAVACGALALALAGGRAAWTVLGGALAWSLYQSAQYDFPTLPSGPRIAAGALVGAGAAALLGAVWSGRPAPPSAGRTDRPAAGDRAEPGGRAAVILGNGRLAVGAVATAALLALTAGLALAARGYVTRNAATDTSFAAPLLRWFETQAAFRDGSDPIATTAPRIALLAGDRLRHRIELIGEHESCASTLALTRRGWVVVLDFPTFLIKFFPRSSAGSCLAPLRPLFASGEFRVYRA